MRPMDISVSHLPNVIFACFVLHNFCEREKVDIDLHVVEQVIKEERSKAKTDRYTTPMGTKVRKAITTYFNEYL